MSMIQSDLLLGQEGGAGYVVSRSLRFNASDSAYCDRSFTSAGNRKTWTFAAWVKLSALTGTNSSGGGTLFHCRNGTGDDGITDFIINTDGTVVFTGGASTWLTTTQVLRDFSAWYHLVMSVDTTAATASNRLRLYINGSQVTTFNVNVSPTQNSDLAINQAATHGIGGHPSQFFNGYLADIHFIDGQALTPSSFAETNATTGQWVPKAYTGSYGTNGFRLDFSDNSAATATTLGKDRAGSNNWTPNNLSVQGGNGSYVDAVTGTPYNSSYPISNMFDGNTGTSYLSGSGTTTWTPASPISFTKFRGNIYQDSGSVNITFNWSGGSYVFTATSTSAPGGWINFTANLGGPITSISWPSGSTAGPYVYAWEVNDQILVDYRFGAGNDSLVDTPTSYGTDTGAGGEVRGNYATFNPVAAGLGTLSNGNLDVAAAGSHGTRNATIGVSSGKWYSEFNLPTAAVCGLGITSRNTAYATWPDNTAGNYWFYFDGGTKYFYPGGGTQATSIGAPATGIWKIALDLDSGKCWLGTGSIWYDSAWNQTGNPATGANPTFSSLPAATYFMFAETQIGTSWQANFGQRPWGQTCPSGFKALCDTNLPAPVVAKPNTAMDVALYTGTGSARSITGLGFSPDFVWIKSRSGAFDPFLYDSIRGTTKALRSQVTNGEETYSQGLTAFNSDGFSVGTDGEHNSNGQTFVAWTWDAGSSTVTNTQGSITSQVRANASAGFSIVTYTGNGTAGATIGHGSGVAPQFVIVKNRSNATNWMVGHHFLDATTPWNYYMRLNGTIARAAAADFWNNTAPSGTVITLGTSTSVNSVDGDSYVAYCFAPVAGYSNGFSYTGNGSTNGSFVYLGFRPRLILLKCSSTTGNWTLLDTAREGYNVDNDPLYPNLSDAEGTTDLLDITSNGFKLRTTDASVNSSGATYVGYAWAEAPFAYSRAR